MNYFQFKQARQALVQLQGLRNASLKRPRMATKCPDAKPADSREPIGGGQLASELRTLHLEGRELEALRIAESAAARATCTAEARVRWALILVDLHRYEQAAQVLHDGANELGSWRLRLQSVLLLPALTESQLEMDRVHARVHGAIHDLTHMPLPADPDIAELALALEPNFFLSYLGEPCVEENAAFGQFVQRTMHAAYPAYRQRIPARVRPQGDKIRVGYATSYAWFHSVMKCVAGWLLNADHDTIELHLFPLGSERDWMTGYLAGLVDYCHEPALDLETAAKQIREANLDVLVYPEIGMDALTMQLAALHLAPVQCSTWGHPPTTGLPSIDYYISSEAMEPIDAANHYTERLVTLPGIGVCVPDLRLSAPSKTRGDFGFHADDVVYFCSQSLFKYLPRHDGVFALIARSVPNAVFVFLASEYPAWVRTFRTRLRDSFSALGLDVEQHVRFFPQMPFEDFLNLNACCDVFLDNIGWSGANTALEALAQDLPVVTLPGQVMRSRHCFGILQQLGMDETIARDVDDYVRIAIQLGQDLAWRKQIKDQIRAQRHLLFEDKRSVQALEAFFRYAVGSANPGDESLFKLWPPTTQATLQQS